jgi:hypothetical protein
MAEARFHVPTEGGRLDPFLSFGWGYFEIFTSEATVIPTAPDLRPVVVLGDTDGAFGVAAGGGMAWAAWPRVSLLANVSYTIGFTESISTQYFPVRVGLGVGF